MARRLYQLSLILCLLLNDVYEVKSQAILWDSIEYGKVTVTGIGLGDSSKKMLEIMGMPDSILTRVNEFEGTEYFEYIYGRSGFDVTGNKVSGFHLKDGSFRFDYGQILVGDRVEILRKLFSISFKSRFKRGENTVVKIKIGDSDSYVLFFYNNDVIKEIMTWDDL